MPLEMEHVLKKVITRLETTKLRDKLAEASILTKIIYAIRGKFSGIQYPLSMVRKGAKKTIQEVNPTQLAQELSNKEFVIEEKYLQLGEKLDIAFRREIPEYAIRNAQIVLLGSATNGGKLIRSLFHVSTNQIVSSLEDTNEIGPDLDWGIIYNKKNDTTDKAFLTKVTAAGAAYIPVFSTNLGLGELHSCKHINPNYTHASHLYSKQQASDTLALYRQYKAEHNNEKSQQKLNEIVLHFEFKIPDSSEDLDSLYILAALQDLKAAHHELWKETIIDILSHVRNHYGLQPKYFGLRYQHTHKLKINPVYTELHDKSGLLRLQPIAKKIGLSPQELHDFIAIMR